MRTTAARSVSLPAWASRTRRALTTALVPVLAAALLAAVASRPDTAHSWAADGTTLVADGSIDQPFRAATFNLLGDGHTAPGGDRKGYASGTQRMGWAVRLLDRNAIDVVGFQEFQIPQFERFQELVGDTWGVYPGDQLSRAAMQNSIAWRTDTWEMVEEDSVPITYTLGATIRMPYVLLRNIDSGRLVWFANFHNASNPRGAGNQQKYRNAARATEVALANQLWESGAPLVLTGDMNETTTYFCQMTSLAPMKAAIGGSSGPGRCAPPAGQRIDWIFGSSFVRFSNWTAKQGRFVQKTTDHPLVFADVTVPTRARF